MEGRSPWQQNQVSPRPSVVDGGGLMKEICLVLVKSWIFFTLSLKDHQYETYEGTLKER